MKTLQWVMNNGCAVLGAILSGTPISQMEECDSVCPICDEGCPLRSGSIKNAPYKVASGKLNINDWAKKTATSIFMKPRLAAWNDL